MNAHFNTKLPAAIAKALLRRPPLIVLAVGLLMCVAMLGLHETGMLQPVELFVHDQYIRHLSSDKPADSRVLIIGVRESDLQSLPWPLPDEQLALLLQSLIDLDARAIGVDIYRDIPIPPGSERLDALLRESTRIVWCYKFGDAQSGGVPPPSVLLGSEKLGFNDLVDDPGGIVRRALLFVDDGEEVHTAFALRLAMLYAADRGVLAEPDPLQPEYLRLGATTVWPLQSDEGGYFGIDARGYQFLLDYQGAARVQTVYSLADVFAGRVPREQVAGRIVLLGTLAESIKDHFYTPLSWGWHANPRTYGVVLQGLVVSQLLRMALEGATPIRGFAAPVEWAWLAIWCLFGALSGLYLRSAWAFSAVTVLALGLLFSMGLVLFYGGWWLPGVPAGLGWLGAAATMTAFMSSRERTQRAMLMQLFARHVSNDVANVIWQARDRLLEGGRLQPKRVYATVLFSDIRSFTTIAEQMPPDALMQWLNEYMERMAELVNDHGGAVNKFVGDAVMAVFGFPFFHEDPAHIARDAANAVDCALAMEHALEQLNDDWQRRGLPEIGIRVGIQSGPLVAGSLGSAQRMEYTVIGDTVNVAARLESYDKARLDPDDPQRVARILIGEDTLRHLAGGYRTLPIGRVSLKGKAEQVNLYLVSKPVQTAHGAKMEMQQ